MTEAKAASGPHVILSPFIKLTSKVDGAPVYIRREVVVSVRTSPAGMERETVVDYAVGENHACVSVVESPDEVMGKLLGEIK